MCGKCLASSLDLSKHYVSAVLSIVVVFICISISLGGVDFSALALLTPRPGSFLVGGCPGLCLLNASSTCPPPVQAQLPQKGCFPFPQWSRWPAAVPRRWRRVWEEGAFLIPDGDAVASPEVLTVLDTAWVLNSLPRAWESVCPHLACAGPRCWSRKPVAGKAPGTSLVTLPPGLMVRGLWHC